MSFLCSLGVILGLPWRLPLLFSLLNPSPRLTVLVLGLPGPPPNLRSSPSPGQDCENYITLLERQGEGLLVCGTNARRPSCWSLVRRPLPICLVSSLLSGWASAPQRRRWGRLTSPGIEHPGGWGPWPGSLPLWQAAMIRLHGCLTPLTSPR